MHGARRFRLSIRQPQRSDYPQDLAATIYHALGIPLHTWYRSQDGRPIELVPEGKPVQQLI